MTQKEETKMSEFEHVTPEEAGIDSSAIEAFLREEKKAGV